VPALRALGEALDQRAVATTVDARVTQLELDLAAATAAHAEDDAWSAHAADAAIRDPALARAVALLPGVDPIAVRARGDWVVERDAAGRALRRRRHGAALVRKHDEATCRLYPVTLVAERTGGGYNAARLTPLEAYQVSRCDAGPTATARLVRAAPEPSAQRQPPSIQR
jgi:hypothetical protein